MADGDDKARSPGSKLDTLSREDLAKFVKKQTVLLQRSRAKCDELQKTVQRLESSKADEASLEQATNQKPDPLLQSKDAEISALQSRVTELEGLCKESEGWKRRCTQAEEELECESEGWKRRCTQVEEELECVRMKDQTMISSLQCLQDEVMHLTQQNKDLAEQSDILIEARDTAVDATQSIKMQRNQLNEDLLETQKKYEDLQAQIVQIAAKNEQLESEKLNSEMDDKNSDKVSQELSDKIAEVNTLQETISELQEKIRSSDVEFSDFRCGYEDLLQTLSQNQANLQEKTTYCDSLLAELSNSRQIIVTLEAEKAQECDKCVQYESEICSLKNSYDEEIHRLRETLKTQDDKSCDMCQSFKEEIESLKLFTEDCTLKLQSSIEDNQQLTIKIEELNSQVYLLEGEMGKNESESEIAKDEVARLHEYISGLEVERCNEREKYNERCAEVEKLQSQLTELGNSQTEECEKCTEMSTEIVNLNEKLTVVSSNETNCGDLKKQVNNLQKECNTLMSQKSMLDYELNEIKEEREMLIHEDHSSKEQLKEWETIMELLRSDKQTATRDLEESDVKLIQYRKAVTQVIKVLQQGLEEVDREAYNDDVFYHEEYDDLLAIQKVAADVVERNTRLVKQLDDVCLAKGDSSLEILQLKNALDKVTQEKDAFERENGSLVMVSGLSQENERLLTQDVDRLTEESGDLQHQVVELQTRLLALGDEEEILDTKVQLEASKVEVLELSAKLKSDAERIVDLETKLSERCQYVQELENKVSELSDKLTSSKKLYEAAQSEIENFDKFVSNSVSVDEVTELKIRIETLENEKYAISNDLQEKDDKVMNLEQNLETVQTERNESNQRVNESIEKIDQLEQGVSLTENDMNQVCTENESLKGHLDELVGELSAAKDELTRLRMLAVERDDLKMRNERLVETKQNYEGQLEGISHERMQLAAELEQARQNLEVSSSECEELRKLRHDVVNDVTEKGNEIARLEGVVNDVRSEKDEVKEENVRLEGVVNEVRSENDEVKEENVRLKGVVNEVRSEKDEVKEENTRLERMVNEVTNEKDKIHEETTRLEGLVNDVTNEKDEIQQENARLEGVVNEVTNEKDGVKEENARLEGVVNEVRSENDEVKEENARLEGVVNEVTSEKDEIKGEIVRLLAVIGEANETVEILEREIGEFKKGVLKYESCLVIKDEEITRLGKNLDDTIEEKRQIEQQIVKNDEEIARLNNIIDSEYKKKLEFETEIANLKSMIETKERNIEDLVNTLESDSKDKDEKLKLEYENVKAELRREIESLKNENITATEKFNGLLVEYEDSKMKGKEEKDILNNRIKDLDSKLNTDREENDRLNSEGKTLHEEDAKRISVLENEKAQLFSDFEELMQREINLNATVENSADRIVELEQENIKLKTVATKNDENIAELKSELSVMSEENEKLIENYTAVITHVREFYKTLCGILITEIVPDISDDQLTVECKKNLINIGEIVENQKKKIEEAEGKYDEVKMEVETLQKKADTSPNDDMLKKLEANVKAKDEMCAKLKAMVVKSKKDVNELSAKLDSKEKELSAQQMTQQQHLQIIEENQVKFGELEKKYTDEINKLQAELDKQTTQTAELRQSLVDASQHNANDLNKTQNDLQNTSSDLERTQNDLHKCRHELDKSQHDLDKSQNDLGKSQNDLEQSKLDVERAVEELVKSREVVAQRNEEVAALQLKLYDAVSDKSNTFHELEEANTRVKSLEKDIEVLRAQVDAATQHSNELEEEITRLQEQHKEQIGTLTSELDVRSKELEEAKQECKQSSMMDLEMADYERSMQKINEDLQTRDAWIGERDSEITRLNERITQLLQQTDSTDKQFAHTEDRANKFKQLLVKSKKDLSEAKKLETELRGSEAQLRGQMECLVQQAEDYKVQMSDISGENLRLRTKISQANEAHQRSAKTLDQKCYQLQVSLNSSQTQLDDLQTEYDGYKVRVHNVLKQQKTRQQQDSLFEAEKLERERLENLVEQLKARLQETSDQVISLKQENDLLTEEHDRLVQTQQKHLRDNLEKDVANKRRLDHMTKEHQLSTNELTDTIQRLTIQNDSLAASFEEEMRTSQDDHMDTLTTLNSRIKSLEADNKRLSLAGTATAPNPPLRVAISRSAERELTDSVVDLVTDIRHVERQSGEGMENVDAECPRTPTATQPTMVPFDQLLSISLDETMSMRSVTSHEDEKQKIMSANDMEKLKDTLGESQRRIEHLTEVLNDSEATVLHLTEQTRLLKEEIRRLERNQKRQEETRNMEYLKNILLKFLSLKPGDERSQLLPVMYTMLKLSDEEKAMLNNIAQGEGHQTATGWGSYLHRWTAM